MNLTLWSCFLPWERNKLAPQTGKLTREKRTSAHNYLLVMEFQSREYPWEESLAG